MSERERFEAAALNVGMFIDFKPHDEYDDVYFYEETNTAYKLWQAALADRPEREHQRLGVHLQHCNFGENSDHCKYGDDTDCPALTESWSWFGRRLQEARSIIEQHNERPEPAQPMRQFGDVRYAAAVDLVRNKEVTLSELWVVWGPPEKDGKRYPEYCAGWPEACHEHINDALDKELDEAKDWIVRQAFLAPQESAQPPIWHRTVENDLEQERLHRERIVAARYVDIVFDGPPSHESGRFVEVEDASGKSIKFGEWVHRPDGYWALRIAAPQEPAQPVAQQNSEE